MRLSPLPLRARLVAGFAGAMLVVLVAAGGFVWWRVQYALDHRLDQDLRTQVDDLRQAAARAAPTAALASLRDQSRDAQLLAADGRVLAAGPGLGRDRPLLDAGQSRRAARGEVRAGRGYLLSPPGRHVRLLAVPVRGHGGGRAAVAVSAVRLDQRDEALRELLAQLAIANLLALGLASLVGYRLARSALDPVERYRAQAETITRGATGVRLDVPEGPADEITRLGATLNAMLDALERAAERQEQFIHDASHELRTPLAALAAEIDLALRRPRSPEEHAATLRRLAADARRLIELTESLLALGALGGRPLETQAVDARALLDAAATRARAQLRPEEPRAVHVEVAPGLALRGDAVLLARALGNLADNAVRHGGGDITLTAAFAQAGLAGVVLSVHDDGPGMAPEFLEHAAGRFRREESSRAGPGTGLGLALADAIATAHRGQLRICSGGEHHLRPTPDAELASVPCRHPDAGTTVALLIS